MPFGDWNSQDVPWPDIPIQISKQYYVMMQASKSACCCASQVTLSFALKSTRQIGACPDHDPLATRSHAAHCALVVSACYPSTFKVSGPRRLALCWPLHLQLKIPVQAVAAPCAVARYRRHHDCQDLCKPSSMRCDLQYSRFIKNGWTILDTAADVSTLAASYQHENGSTEITVVTTNSDTSSSETNWEFGSTSPLQHVVEIYRTSATENFARQTDAVLPSNGLLQYGLPQQSITTFHFTYLPDSVSTAAATAG